MGSNATPTILITGASGFIAAHILNEFLDQGYLVRGTVRSEATADKVRKTHARHGDKLSFAIVPDIAAPDGFDDAVKGVDGVIHTASPFTYTVTNNERDLLNPAINGTTSLLTAIQTHNPGVKRVVLTSSIAAILDPTKAHWPGHTYTERDWNPLPLEKAKKADPRLAYLASKTYAEKAAFAYVDEHQPHFSIATICPPMVYGPAAHAIASLDELNTSSADIYRLMNGSCVASGVPSNSLWAFVDVRDVATAHRLAYEKRDAAGQRFLVASGSYSYQMCCDVIREQVPEVRERVPEGVPGSGLGKEVYGVDNSRAREVLGMEFRGLEETVGDMAREFVVLEKGLLHANGNGSV